MIPCLLVIGWLYGILGLSINAPTGARASMKPHIAIAEIVLCTPLAAILWQYGWVAPTCALAWVLVAKACMLIESGATDGKHGHQV